MTAADIIYGPLTPIYDVICGAALQPGRRRALELLEPAPGERILEVGVGTGLDLNDYPRGCRVAAVDLSAAMMARARHRIGAADSPRVDFLQMDAMRLAFRNETFDAVYVPYTINVVPDPLAVGRELVRVCRHGGRVLMLNHFDGIPETSNTINAIVGRLAEKFSVNWHLRADRFVRELGLQPIAVESVNVPRLSSIVLCRKNQRASE